MIHRRPRAEFLADPKPWLREGISKTTYYHRREIARVLQEERDKIKRAMSDE